jgi:hypothetical protein
MDMTKQLIINYDPEIDESLWDMTDAAKDIVKRFDSLNKTVLKAERQLLKFDEINKLVAHEVQEKTAGTGKSSGGSSKSSTKSSTKTETEKKATTPKEKVSSKAKELQSKTGSTKNVSYYPSDKNKSEGSIYFTISDVLFDWHDLNWEQIMMKIVAGLGALGGALTGYEIGGVPGAIIGLAAGLLFGISLDEAIFNFDGQLQPQEIWKSLLTVVAPIVGGILGSLAMGPTGALIGLTVGIVFSFVVAQINWNDVIEKWDQFFADLNENFDLRWEGFKRHVKDLWAGIKTWWQGLSFGRLNITLPHIVVQWQELADNSILARFLGLTAIPHLSVEWYARGGIVDGPTLIGAGEAGKEAIIPLERNTFWIHEVAVQLKAELEKLAPSNALTLVSLPAAASGSLVPPSASAASASLDLTGLADTIAEAIASLGNQTTQGNPIIHVYLDGKQLTDVVTKYQRRESRAFG